MQTNQQFRTAFRGFNKEDVVQYIEFMNNKHKSQLEQVNTQLQNTKDELAKYKAAPQDDTLQKELDAARARIEELEAQLAQAPAVQAPAAPTEQELEAYRRAERAERMAQERAAQIYAQANAALAEVSLKVQSAVEGVKAVAEQASTQLQSTQAQLQEAVDTLAAIRPESE